MPMEARCCTNAMDSVSEETAAALATYLKGQSRTPELIQLIQKLIAINSKYNSLLSIFVDDTKVETVPISQ